MTNNDYYYFTRLASLKDKLKPTICKACRDEGLTVGECKKCLENRAWNEEYIHTHAFPVDTHLRNYHSCDHDVIKRCFKRLPNEHPYLYYGIELEIEFDNDWVAIDNDDYYDSPDNTDIDDLLADFTQICPLFVYERDGSLDNGVEMITPPCSYAFLTQPDTVKMLEDGMKFLREHGALVNQPNTNGFHIHISRKFFDFGETTLENRTDAYKDFDWFFQVFQSQFEKIGRRAYTQYCASKKDKAKNEVARLANSLGANISFEGKFNLKRGGEMARGDHYSAVNLSGNTIEARTFKSTTDYREVLATVEVVRNIAHAVRNGQKNISFNELLHTKDNLYLDKYLNQIKMDCARNKQEFNMEEVAQDTITINE